MKVCECKKVLLSEGVERCGTCATITTLRARLGEVERSKRETAAVLDKNDAHLTRIRLALDAVGVPDCAEYEVPEGGWPTEHERALHAGGHMLKQDERVRRLAARATAAEARAGEWLQKFSDTQASLIAAEKRVRELEEAIAVTDEAILEVLEVDGTDDTGYTWAGIRMRELREAHAHIAALEEAAKRLDDAADLLLAEVEGMGLTYGCTRDEVRTSLSTLRALLAPEAVGDDISPHSPRCRYPRCRAITDATTSAPEKEEVERG